MTSDKLNELIDKHNELCRLLQDMNLNPLADFNNLEVEENDWDNEDNTNEEENEEPKEEKPKLSF